MGQLLSEHTRSGPSFQGIVGIQGFEFSSTNHIFEEKNGSVIIASNKFECITFY